MMETNFRSSIAIEPGSFSAEKHFYPRALNAHMHPVVADFLNLPLSRLIERYCQIRPKADRDALLGVLTYQPRFLYWAGADLFFVANGEGRKDMMLIETNSSPSGQKSMPRLGNFDDYGGYRTLVESVLGPLKRSKSLPEGGLAVLYDKNEMEASGYAATMADIFNEKVYLTPFYNDDTNPPVRFRDGILEVRHDSSWCQIRAALRYVTQKPWGRIPLNTRSLIFNPVIACLAGGRNKACAAVAYEAFNRELSGSGLAVHMPETIRGVDKESVPDLVRAFGNMAVVKAPYANAGQDIFTITNENELRAFMSTECKYDQFIVQRMIGCLKWTANRDKKLFGHIGTVPDQQGNSYVSDLRFMIGAGNEGFKPVALYSRRARVPLSSEAPQGLESWDMLGTNLSVNLGNNQWKTEDQRLIQMDYKDFPSLGLGLDDLIKAFVQTVLASVAIDKLACSCYGDDQLLDLRQLKAVISDHQLFGEIY